MEKKLVKFTVLADLKLKKKQFIDLDKLATSCIELDVKYNPELGFRAVQLKIESFYFSVFKSGKINIMGHHHLNESELDDILNEFFEKKIKFCIFEQ